MSYLNRVNRNLIEASFIDRFWQTTGFDNQINYDRYLNVDKTYDINAHYT